jgi:proline iminopeptidase
VYPEPVDRTVGHLNRKVYVLMQRPSELGTSGKIVNWDRAVDLPKIVAPTLIIGARFDTVDPKYMEMMAHKVQKGRYLNCPSGSHMAMYDNQKVYVEGVIKFILDVDWGRF